MLHLLCLEGARDGVGERLKHEVVKAIDGMGSNIVHRKGGGRVGGVQAVKRSSLVLVALVDVHVPIK